MYYSSKEKYIDFAKHVLRSNMHTYNNVSEILETSNNYFYIKF